MSDALIDTLFTNIAELAVILTVLTIVLMCVHAALRPKVTEPGDEIANGRTRGIRER